MDCNLQEITFSTHIFEQLTPVIQHECRLIGTNLIEHGICFPSNNPQFVTLDIDYQKRYLMLKFLDKNQQETTFLLSMSPYVKLIREYRQICHAYKEALIQSHASAIETIDMARRGLHNQAAELISERVQDKLTVNHQACRDLFTIMTLLIPIK